MRFYAACLASYNNGVLHGRWIDACADTDEMQEEISAMLRASRFPNVTVKHPETGEDVPSAEEWAVHDHEGLPSSLGEYPGLQVIADYVELVESHDHMDADDIAAIVAYFGSVEAAKGELEDRFAGTYSAFSDYANEQADEMLASHSIPDNHPLRTYFDYDQYARELEMSMTAVDVPSGVAIFYA